MALTPVNKIYSPELTDTPLARTQMHAMASSVEYAINSLRESLNAPLENVLARIVELESRPGGAGGGSGATIISITTEDNELVFKMSDGRVLRTSIATNPDGNLSLYVERVEAAQVAADNARAALQDLTSDLGAAKGAVAAVANRIGAVESAISDVDARATQVAGAAADASSEAKDALTRAGNAEVKALEAASVASGKGKMIHSATPPTGEDAAITNLWIRASDSKAHRWDGARWIAVTDKAILDAAAAADNAQSTATKAVADATSAASAAQAASMVAIDAHLTAGKAVSDASIAQAAAEEAEHKALEAAGIAAGKGKVIYGGTAPTGSDAAAENLWIRSSDNRPHRWDGARWVEVTDAAVVASAAAASAAQAKADKAERDAAAAQVAADTAQAAANAADNKAAAAAQAASAAQSTANKAVSDAATAQAAANAADTKALQAAGIADGKGRVIYSTTAPGTADRLTQNLWVRLPDNVPHRWSGSAWVAITDKTATDAANAAANAQTAANAAKTTADKAVADAATAKQAADAAQAAAQNAQGAADAAQVAAQRADVKAVNAATAASAAQTTANQAVTDAATAQSAANNANAKALAAAGIADGKGKVIYSTSAPGTTERLSQNLWVRLPDNVPHRWSGSQWVAVTDKTATDAAQAAAQAASAAQAAAQVAAAAKTTADKAVQDAAEAASAAQAANIAAGNAQRTADGKTVALFGAATPPPAPGVAKGDLYYRTGPDNRIIEQWQWSGSAWVKRAIESSQLANFDAGYITSGYLDVAKRIQAGSITADKIRAGSITADSGIVASLDAGKITTGTLDARRIATGSITADKMLIGIGDNLVPNGNGGAGEGWEAFNRETNPAESNGYPGSFWVQGQKVPRTSRFPIRPGVYRFSVDARTSVPAGARFYVQLAFFRAGVHLSYFSPVVNQVLHTEYRTYTGQVTAPAGADSYEIRIFSMHSNGTVDEAGKCWYTGFELREMKDGSLIVNGSITGEKVNAESVAAAVGTFVKVNAENVAVTGELAARVVNAMTAQVKNLVVTESAILQHSTLLGDTTAEHLNVTKKLVARNAIVDGTLDVEQLNVTSAMSAEIVSAMSVESKKLVVSDEAILNKATVVQSLVTPELVAERIDVTNLGARLLTAGAIQTDATPNRGIKMTNQGIAAWDADGKQTLILDGKANKIVGEFSTGFYGDPRVNIYNKYNPSWGITESIIDMQASGMGGVSSYDNAVTRLTSSAREGFSITTGGKRRLQLDQQGAVLSADHIVLNGRNSTVVNGDFTLNGKITPTNYFHARSGGPYTLDSYGVLDITFTHPDTGEPPMVIPVLTNNVTSGAVTISVHSGTRNSTKVRLHNTWSKPISNLWVDLFIMPVKRLD